MLSLRKLLAVLLLTAGCGGQTPLGPRADDETSPKIPERKSTIDKASSEKSATDQATKEKPQAGGYDEDILSKRIEESMSKLSAEDRKLAEAQKYCPVGVEFDDDGKPVGGRLGSIGKPVKVMVEGAPVFIACPSCTQPFKDDTASYMKVLAKIRASQQKVNKDSPQNQSSPR